jgi:hypothetical protein
MINLEPTHNPLDHFSPFIANLGQFLYPDENRACRAYTIPGGKFTHPVCRHIAVTIFHQIYPANTQEQNSRYYPFANTW